MRRDLLALIIILCAIGLLFAGVHRVPHPVDTAFSFGMTTAQATQQNVGRTLDVSGAAPASTYDIVLQPGPADVPYRAEFNGRTASGTLSAAEYRQFLEGFFKNGGQGRESMAAMAGLVPVELAQAEDREEVPAIQARARAMPVPQPQGMRKPSSLYEPQANVIQSSYWYELEGNGHKQRYIVMPFSNDGRQVLAYLQTTVVFRMWNQFQR